MSGGATRQQFADTMLAVGLEDPRLMVLVGDISHFLLQPFAAACPGRYHNVGICEPALVGMAAGLARVGFVPVVHTIAPFLVERAFEQIKLDACYQKLGLNLVTVGSAFDYSNLGCTHHCYGDFALMKTLEGTRITAPASPAEFDALFRQSYDAGTVNLFRIAGAGHGLELDPGEIRLGEAIRVREGRSLTLVATGPQVESARRAVDGLLALGFDPEILYVHTIRPLDTGRIRESVARTGRVLVVEEHMRSGGLGDDVLRAVADLPGCRFASLAIPDRFVRDYGSYEEQCRALGLSAEGVVRRAREAFGSLRRRAPREARTAPAGAA